jgi:hypothetical protein
LAILAAQGVAAKQGEAAGFYHLAAWVADNAQYGPLTGQAITRLASEAKDAADKAAKAEAKAKASKDRIAAAVDTLTPQDRKAEAAAIIAATEAKAATRAQVTEAPKAAAPKRQNRKAKATGTAALVKANAPQDGGK